MIVPKEKAMSRQIAPKVKVKAISFCRRNRLQIQIQPNHSKDTKMNGADALKDTENPPRKSRAMTACPKSNMAELNVLALRFARSFAAAIVAMATGQRKRRWGDKKTQRGREGENESWACS